MADLVKKILIVDDETDLLETYQFAMEEMGFKVLTSSSTEEAFKLVQEHAADLLFVICDYTLNKQITGFHLRKKMLDAFMADIPFAIISGNLTKEIALAGVDHKICAFIDKPFNMEELQKLIDGKSVERLRDIEDEFEMIGGFQSDAQRMMTNIEDSLLQLEDNPNDLSLIDNVMRLLHTIKGTSGCLKLINIQKFSHRYEDFFSPIKRQEAMVTPEIVSVALKAYDTLKLMIENIEDSGNDCYEIENHLSIFEQAQFQTSQSKDDSSNGEKNNNKQASSNEATGLPQKDEEISVATKLLDEFMEQSGELTVLRSILVKQVRSLESEIGNSVMLERLVEALDEMHNVSGTMQNKIVEIRKVPLKHVLRNLPRVARDTCSETNKKVKLSVSGDELRVDTSIGQVLSNSLVHVIRNCVDHGIEATSEDRKAAGKNEIGQIEVNCYEKGEDVVLEINDDGRGVDPERVAAKCIEKNLLTAEEVSRMDEQSIKEMIFAPGFSTADVVTNVSGRGVGMDMLKESVTKIGGNVKLESALRVGTKLTLTLPIPKSVLIIKALFVEVGKEVFAINQDDIHRVVYVDEDRKSQMLRQIEGKTFLLLNNSLLPMVSLADVLNINDSDTEKDQGTMRVVVLQGDNCLYGVQVDEVHDNEEIVVKDFSQQIKRISIYTGATFLGDGKVSLVLDTEGLAKFLHIDKKSAGVEQRSKIEAEMVDEKDHPLKHSLLVIKTLNDDVVGIPLNRIFRLEEFEKQKVEVVGKQPLIRYLNSPLPIYVLDQPRATEIKSMDLENFKTVICRNESGYTGFVVKEIRDIAEVTDALDPTMADERYEGTTIVNGQVVPIIRFDDKWSSCQFEKMHRGA